MRLPDKIVAVDTETTGLNPYKHRPLIISYYSTKEDCGVFRIDKDVKFDRLKDPTEMKLFFNAKFDLSMLSKVGIHVRGPIIDISIMYRILFSDELHYTLKYLARKFLKELYLEEVKLKEWLRINKTKVYTNAPDHILYPYALKDAEVTRKLLDILIPYLDKNNGWITLRKEMNLMPAVMRMERRGIFIDTEFAEKLKAQAYHKIGIIMGEIHKLTYPEFNPASNLQLSKMLYPKGGWTHSTKGGKPSVDKLALLELKSTGNVLADLVMKYRKLVKATNTYIDNVLLAMDSSSIFRVSFNQMGACTGRFSSSGYDVKGQIQNIPRPDKDPDNKRTILGQIRNIFAPAKGYIIACFDYDQIEMRLRAHFSNDTQLIDNINKGADIHSLTAIRILGQDKYNEDPVLYRQVFKSMNYAVQYGVGPEKFGLTLFKETEGKVKLTLEQAATYIGMYKDTNLPLMELFNKVEGDVVLTGGVTNPYGRYIPVDITKPYIGVNYLIQSTAADVIKEKMLLLDKWNQPGINMLLQVHDELVFEIDKDIGKWAFEYIREVMEEKRFKVPLTVTCSVGKRWGHKKKLQLS